LTSNTIQLLLIGIVFLIIGVYTVRLKKQKKIEGIIAIILGLGAIGLTTSGPLSQSQKHINKILEIDKNKVVKISIKPTTYKGHEEISLTKTIIEITERETIDNLCNALTSANSLSTIMKNPKWACLIRIDINDNTFLEFAVKGSRLNTIIEVNSDGDYGWNFGAIEASSFGEKIISIAK